MRPSAIRLLHWSPRILGIAFAAFLGVLALDIFREGHGFWGTLPALLIHLIPCAIVIAGLAIAWRWEEWGAALFLLAGGYYAWSVLPRHLNWAFTVAGPLLLIGMLFLASSIEHRRQPAAH